LDSRDQRDEERNWAEYVNRIGWNLSILHKTGQLLSQEEELSRAEWLWGEEGKGDGRKEGVRDPIGIKLKAESPVSA